MSKMSVTPLRLGLLGSAMLAPVDAFSAFKARMPNGSYDYASSCSRSHLQPSTSIRQPAAGRWQLRAQLQQQPTSRKTCRCSPAAKL